MYIQIPKRVAGVSFDPRRRRWVAKICFQQKTHFLGYFNSKEEAIAARVKGEHQYYDTYLASHKNLKNTDIIGII
jgi:hypothetical protein